jgi:hypothetical protein
MMPQPLPGAPTTGRRRTVIEYVPTPGRPKPLILAVGATAAGYLAAIVCAATPTGVGLVIALAAAAAAEAWLVRGRPFAAWGLDQMGLALVARGALRGIPLVLFAARATSPAVTITLAAAVTVLTVLRGAHVGAAIAVHFLRTPPIVSRNLPLDVPAVPAPPAAALLRPAAWTPVLDVVLAAGLAAAAHGAESGAYVAVAVALVAGLAGPLVLLAHAYRLYRGRVRARFSAAVVAAIARLRPEVVVYFSNGPEWRYQLEMWLSTLATVQRRVLLLVREHEVLQTLAPTNLPVVSVPGGGTLMELPIPGVRAGLYVGNGAYNVHLLRRPGIRSVFIGHGDSDKGASANPVSRVYQEIWVAGPAGRQRYTAAGIDLPDSTFVEVGRPQLREIPRRAEHDQRVTVLYAPTWEGWGEDAFHSSLPHLGPQLVRALLDRDDVRVMYRPHPRTGHRDPATRAAHLEIVALLEAAGAGRPGAVPLPPPPSGRPPRSGDLLELALAPPGEWSPAEHDAAVRQWTDAFWAAHPGHRILTPPAPDLHACFEMADALVADISSVPNDFLAANRPYAVVNCTGRPAADFRARSATAQGGFVLDADLADLDALIRAAGPGPDPTAAARAEARRYLLGPRAADPAARFREELDRICRSPHYVG